MSSLQAGTWLHFISSTPGTSSLTSERCRKAQLKQQCIAGKALTVHRNARRHKYSFSFMRILQRCSKFRADLKSYQQG
jgi:hypothetical protein